jgi:hypothetical protein
LFAPHRRISKIPSSHCTPKQSQMAEEDLKEGPTHPCNSAAHPIFDTVSLDTPSNCRHSNGSQLLRPTNATSPHPHAPRPRHPRASTLYNSSNPKTGNTRPTGKGKSSRTPFRSKTTNKPPESHAQSPRKLPADT